MKQTNNTQQPVFAKRLALMNRYYKITRFYSFLRSTSIKAGIVIVGFVVIFVALDYFLIDFDALFNKMVDTFSPVVVFLSFLLSETILGLVPPEIFIGLCRPKICLQFLINNPVFTLQLIFTFAPSY